MQARTFSHNVMKQANEVAIFECVRRHGPLTRREVQKITDLSWGTVSKVMSAGIHSKLFVEVVKTVTKAGRSPTCIDINTERNLILALDINVVGISAVVVDLKGEVKQMVSENIKSFEAEDILNQIDMMVAMILGSYINTDSTVLGIGSALQGSVNVEAGISVFNPHFKNWKNIPFKEHLEGKFHLPVFVEHDPNCLALSELVFGRHDKIDDAVFIRYGMGIGMSIIQDGQIVRGRDGNAGEMGHMIMVDGGDTCYCGNKGCLETLASATSIIRAAGDKFLKPNGGYSLKRREVIKRLALEAENGNAEIATLFKKAGTYMGRGIANVVNILNPDQVIVCGIMTQYRHLYADDLLAAARGSIWSDSSLNISYSVGGRYQVAVGAAGILVNKILSGHLQLH